MTELKNENIPNDIYTVILENIKTGFIHGSVIGVLIVIGVGIKVTFFNSKKQQNKARAILTSLGFKSLIPTLNDYELSIASQLIKPSDIDVTFSEIAGLSNTVTAIKSNIILPLLTYKFLKSKSRLLGPPKGVLLYGPPGCGKTLLAKATAKEANARFINLEIPTLTDKWYGESQKYALAVFTLAVKVQPCIVFIDEIDTFLRARGTNDHEVTAMVKAQFMILWDGLISTENSGIMVLGATNRPFDVDEAILRRMPTRLQIPKPDNDMRSEILKLFLSGEAVEDVDLDKLAEETEGFSGSDLKELCRNAVSTPVKENETTILDLVRKGDEIQLDGLLSELRSVTSEDFSSALKEMQTGDEWKKSIHCCATVDEENQAKITDLVRKPDEDEIGLISTGLTGIASEDFASDFNMQNGEE